MKKSLAMSSSLRLLPLPLPLHLLLITLSLTNGITLPVQPAGSDPCQPNPCQNGGSCTVVVYLEGDRPSCSCVGGNRGKDDFCNRAAPKITPKAKNPCEPNPCGPDGKCNADPYHEFSPLNFKCICDTDRTGARCEIETGRPKGDFHPFDHAVIRSSTPPSFH